MLRKVLLTGVGLVLIGLMRLGFNAVALHLFNEQLAGTLNVALSLAVMLSLPASTSFANTTVRFVAQARGQGRAGVAAWAARLTLVATVVTLTLTALAVYLCEGVIARRQELPLALVREALAIGTAYALYLFFRNLLYALDRVKLYAALELVGGLVFFVTLAVLAALGAGEQLLFAFLAAYGVFAIATAGLTRSLWQRGAAPQDEARPAFAEIASFSLMGFIGTASSLSVRELAIVLTPHFTDLGAAAHLGLSMSLLAPLQFLPRMLRTVLFAHSAEMDGRGRRHELAASLTEANHWLLFATLPACGLLIVGAAPLLTLMGGQATPERLLVFRLLTAAALFEVVATPAANALPGAGNMRTPAYAALGALALTVGAWWLLVPGHGLTGVALGVLVNAVVKGGVPIWTARRSLGARLTRAPLIAIALLVLTAVACVGVSLWPQPYVVGPLFLVAVAPVIAGGVRTSHFTLFRRRKMQRMES